MLQAMRAVMSAVAAGALAGGILSPAVGKDPGDPSHLSPPVSAEPASRRQAPELAGVAGDDKPVVALVYLVPSDRRPIPGFERVLQNALVHVQRWYTAQVGTSFTVASPVMRTVATAHPSAWYASTPNGPDRVDWFIHNVAAEGFKETGGGWYSRTIVSVIYIDAEMEPGQHGGAGADGAAVLHRLDIEGLLGRSNASICRWVGGLGHELGHALGRPHPPGCDGGGADRNAGACQTLMYTGMYAYPKTTLAAEDRMALDQSVFFGNRISFSAPPFDCERIGKIAVQAPGTAVANCDLSTPGPHAPRHICYLGLDGDRAIHGFFDKTGTDRWHEISPVISVDWTVVSESQVSGVVV